MANITRTQVDISGPVINAQDYRDELVTFTGAATYSAGTIMARDSVSGKLIAFVKGGSTNGNGVPKAILNFDVTAAGAGDVPTRVPLRGQYRLERLIILADGNATNIDGAVVDQLRDYQLTPISTAQQAVLDN